MGSLTRCGRSFIGDLYRNGAVPTGILMLGMVHCSVTKRVYGASKNAICGSFGGTNFGAKYHQIGDLF